MKLSVTLLLFILSLNTLIAKEVAITIDDLPFVRASAFTTEKLHKMFTNILEVLAHHKIKIVGFTIGRIENDQTKGLMGQLVADGHLVGNHTYSHPDYNKTPIGRYITDIEKGEKAIIQWANNRRYFRYPMLHRGNTFEKLEAVKKYLQRKSYTIVPVTIDNDEWIYNRDFMKAKRNGNIAKAKEIGISYLKHMKEKTAYFERLAHDLLGREVRHILLLHMNQLNAEYLRSLLDWYNDNGWSFITIEKALKDPVYSMKDKYIGNNGISWLKRIEL